MSAAAALSQPSTKDHQLSTVLWLTPQELADQRLQHEIDEMVAGRRPAYPLTRSSRRDAHRSPVRSSL